MYTEGYKERDRTNSIFKCNPIVATVRGSKTKISEEISGGMEDFISPPHLTWTRRGAMAVTMHTQSARTVNGSHEKMRGRA